MQQFVQKIQSKEKEPDRIAGDDESDDYKGIVHAHLFFF